MSETILTAENLKFRYDSEQPVYALDGVSTSVKRGEFVAVLGANGCGKSTLALLLARARGGNVLRLSAPEAGLQQLRRQLTGVDILVLDELHRFSKAQQDFFLPLLESGDLTMIATTTENPSFSVTRQLLSRLHVLRLRQKSIAQVLHPLRVFAHQCHQLWKGHQ